MKNIGVCILDDNEPLLKVVVEIISKHYEIRGTSNVNEFIGWCTERPTVAIADWHLTQVTGMHVIKKVLEINELCHPIFISSQASVPMLNEIIDTGFGSFFVEKDKTDWLDDLIKKIGRAKERLFKNMEASNKEMQRRKVLEEKMSETLKILGE
jgi:DNA-binding NtrC family response regulator